MTAQRRICCLCLAVPCGLALFPRIGEGQAPAQQMPVYTSNTAPFASPAPQAPSSSPPTTMLPVRVTGAGAPPAYGLAAPGVRPFEKPLPINLATALGIANVQPWDILAASERVRVASGQLLSSSVLWLPTIYSGGVYDIHVGASQSTDGTVSTTPTTNFLDFGTTPQFQFACTEAIFEPLATRRLFDSRKADLQAVTNDVTLAIARSYFTVLEARGDLAAASEVIRHNNELIRKIESLAKEGLVAQVEVERAKAQFARFQQSERSARERWNVAGAELVRILRIDPTTLLAPLEPPSIQITLISPDQPLEMLLPVALLGRPELASYRALTESTLKRWREEQFRPFIPLVFARGNSTQTPDPLAVSAFGGGPGGTDSNFRTRFDYQVQVLWELKNLGFGNIGLIRQRKAEYEGTKIQAYRMQDYVAREVAEALAQMQSAHDRVAMAEEGLKQAILSADHNYAALGEVKRVGGQLMGLVIRPLEAIAAEQALLQAYYDYFGAVGDYNRSQFQLYRALGNPGQALSLLDQVLAATKEQANPAPAAPPAVKPPPAPNPPPAPPVTPVGGINSATSPAKTEPISAALHIRVPANAELFCDNVKLQLTGVERAFVSPPLPPGRTFTYTIRARWMGQDGRVNDLTRTVQVEAGRRASVDFLEGK